MLVRRGTCTQGRREAPKIPTRLQQGRFDGVFTVKPKEKAAPAKGKADAKGERHKVRAFHVTLFDVLTSLCRG